VTDDIYAVWLVNEWGVSLGFKFSDDVVELPGHEVIVDDDGESACLLVVADGAGD
jgi:hypothetical protein